MVLHFEKSKSERLWLHQPGIAEQQKGGKEKEKEMQSPGVSCTHTDGRLGGTDLDKWDPAGGNWPVLKGPPPLLRATPPQTSNMD